MIICLKLKIYLITKKLIFDYLYVIYFHTILLFLFLIQCLIYHNKNLVEFCILRAEYCFCELKLPHTIAL